MRMTGWVRMGVVGALLGASAAGGWAQERDGVVLPGGVGEQTSTGEYTRYELLAPETASFKIVYEVTATTTGAKYYYNPIRKGSVASDESVYDPMTGRPLEFKVVNGAEARGDALMGKADVGTDYIRVTLARPVPEHGEGRVVIVKTYKDAKSYYVDGRTIVFNRPLGIRRNKVVLPAGYEVVGCTVPSQIGMEEDGRVGISFMHAGAGAAPLVLTAVKDAAVGVRPRKAGEGRSWESPYVGLTERERMSERAHQDREITYFLQQPETHAFRLFHDYTESRVGVNGYANVVRTGSTASDASAYVLDTGEVLKVRTMTGAGLKATGLRTGEVVDAGASVVVIPFRAVEAGGSVRLRIAETYTAPKSYRLEGEEMVFERSLDRARNVVVLPSGWYCTFSAAPATVSQMPDGRVRMEFWADGAEGADVLVKGRRRGE